MSNKTITDDTISSDIEAPPKYAVLLWDDNEHTVAYAMRMLQELFGVSKEQAHVMVTSLDKGNCVCCLLTTLEHAELKRDQIHAYGNDPAVAGCRSAMRCTIEVAKEA
ncbi:MAG: ATP-dependent Clp protease adaptor ClpS [Candidatus Thorarchaeota archaeon]|jgi:ATP-dependent Clp protease adaptor protein ClpS